MISAYQLNQIRTTHQMIGMPDKATIFRRTMADNDRGGARATYSDESAETTPCRLAFYSNRPMMTDNDRGGRIEAAERYLFTAPLGLGLNPYDRLQVNGAMFEIISASDDQTAAEYYEAENLRSFQTAIRLLVKKV
jgi:hypothetical protein